MQRLPKITQCFMGGLVVSALGWLITELVVAFKVRQITHPAKAAAYAPPLLKNGQPLRVVHFQTTDGLTLTGWYLPPQNGATVILQHGYRANSAQMWPVGQLLAQQGYGVLLFDFRGHGQSAGELVTLGLHEVKDTHAAVTFLQQQPEVNPHKIGLLGNSMGGATGVLAAAENPAIRALALEGVFAELKEEVGIGIQVQTPLPPEPFATIFILLAEWRTGCRLREVAPVQRIGAISPRPVFIMHGGHDARVARDSGARLFAAAGEPKEYWYEPAAAHVAFYKAAPEAYAQRVLHFFDTYLVKAMP